jgi:tellurite methyltransferase
MAEEESKFGKPDPLVLHLAEVFSPCSVLDLGAGYGRHSLFLAEKGFRVKALDASAELLEELQHHASRKGLRIETQECDLRVWETSEQYDVILCSLVLHRLKRDVAERLLKKIQFHTRPGGLNLVILITNRGEFFERDPRTSCFFPDPGWLKEFYWDWEVVQHLESERSTTAVKDDGTPYRNITSRILAGRPF